MIARTEVMLLLLHACPSFAGRWRAHAPEYRAEDQQLLYVDLGVFAQHIVELYGQGRTEELSQAFEVIERLHKEGDEYVREATTIGLLEAIQNLVTDRVDAEGFVRFLGLETGRWWNELNAFWQGERGYVGEGLTDTDSGPRNHG